MLKTARVHSQGVVRNQSRTFLLVNVFFAVNVIIRPPETLDMRYSRISRLMRKGMLHMHREWRISVRSYVIVRVTGTVLSATESAI